MSMLHSRFAFPGSAPAEKSIVADPKHQASIRRFAPNRSAQIVNLSDVQLADVVHTEVHGFEEDSEHALRVMSALRHLRSLTLPNYLVPLLSATAFPLLEMIVVTGSKPARLPADFCSKTLKRLAAPTLELSFNLEQVPNVEDFNVLFDSKGKILEQLNRYTHLRAVSISVVKELPLLTSAAYIRFLTIFRSRMSSLSGIGAYSNLTDLKMSDLPKLVDLSPIGQLSHLEELTIAFCPNIVDLSPLKSVGLKKIEIYGSRHLSQASVSETLNTNSLSECIASPPN